MKRSVRCLVCSPKKYRYYSSYQISRTKRNVRYLIRGPQSPKVYQNKCTITVDMELSKSKLDGSTG